MENKVILVTGALSGLGKEIVKILSEGNIVYCSVRGKGDKQKDLELWAKSNNNINILEFDITDDDGVKRAFSGIVKKQGRINAVINVAGITLIGPTADFSPDEYLKILSINAVGTFRVIKEAVFYMKKQKTGTIINITSLNGFFASPNFGLYSSSKFAIDALGQSLFYELKKYGINIVNVAPGAISQKQETGVREMPHKPAREKLFILKLLLPMISSEKVAEKIKQVIECKNPPRDVILGRDAKIIYLLKKLLPGSILDKIILSIWNKK